MQHTIQADYEAAFTLSTQTSLTSICVASLPSMRSRTRIITVWEIVIDCIEIWVRFTETCKLLSSGPALCGSSALSSSREGDEGAGCG